MRRFLRVIGLLLLLALVGAVLLLVSHRKLYWDSHQELALSRHLSVLSLNTHRMGEFRKTPDNEVIRYLLQTDVDILCLQEVEVYHDSHYLTFYELKRAFAKYPYSYFDFSVYNRRRQFGNVIFSRYPLENKHTIHYESRSNISSACNVIVGPDTLRLITNHLESRRLEQQDIDSIVQTRSLSSGELDNKVWRSCLIRRQQAKAVRQEVKSSPYPVIVVGDMNTIPLSTSYLILRCGMRDCFLQTSDGRLGATMFYHHIPLRLDYIFCTKDLYPQSFCVDTVTCSDHFPVITTLAW